MYLILGNDEFLLSKKVSKKVKKLGENSSSVLINFNLIENDFNDLMNELMSFSMFGENKIIVIEESWFLTEKKVALHKNFDLEKLKKYMETPNPNNKIIFVLNNDKISKKLLISKFFEKKTEVNLVPELTSVSAFQMITNKLNKEGIGFEKEAIIEFLDKLPIQARVLINETNKLIMLRKNVNLEVVRNVLGEYFNYDIFEISNYFLNRDLENFLLNYRSYRQQNKDFFSFASLVASSLILMRNILILKQKAMNNSEIATYLNVNLFRVNKILQINFGNFNQINDKIKEMYALISNIFEGNFDDKIIPELFFIKALLI